MSRALLRRPAAFLTAFALVVALFSALSISSARAAPAGACVMVKKSTAETFKKRTQAVKKTRKKFKAAKKKFKVAKRKGAASATRAKLKRQVTVAKKKFRAAKKKRKAVVAKRQRVCAPSLRIVSVSSKGVRGNAKAHEPVVSADDRYVAFTSEATNLVPGDTNGAPDVFVHDRVTRKTTRVSVTSAGKQIRYGGTGPAISADGRYVAFASDSPGLGIVRPNDLTWNGGEVFVHDRRTGKTERATHAANGGLLNGWPGDISISDDGRYVSFISFATNVVSGAQSEMTAGYYVDRVAKKNYRFSVSPTGAVANSWVRQAQMSGNGRFVVYTTDASNYGFPAARSVPFDDKVFMWDRTTNRSRIVSVNPNGTLMDMVVANPTVSTDGNHVLFDKKKVLERDATSMSSAPESIRLYDRSAAAGSYTKTVRDGYFYTSYLSPDATHFFYRGRDGFMVIRNLKTGKEFPVLRRNGGTPDGWVEDISISAGGRVAVFSSDSTNLLKKKVSGEFDQVYLRVS